VECDEKMATGDFSSCARADQLGEITDVDQIMFSETPTKSDLLSFPHVFSGNPPISVMDSCLRRNDKPPLHSV
jgi:hypothetical protein